MISIWKVVLFFILTVFTALFARSMWNLQPFRIIHNHSPGECKIYNIPGAEDMDLVPGGIAIISSGLKYNMTPDVDPKMYQRPGQIYSFDFANPSEGPRKVKLVGIDSSSFNPHGISSFYNRETKQVTIFVINHGRGKTVEIFNLDLPNLSLIHRRTVTDPLIYAPNNLVATGMDSFYLTNDHYFNNVFLKLIEVFCAVPLCEVVYFDGQSARVVAGGMANANGINTSPDGKYVYIAAVSAGGINVFKRHENNDLTKIQGIPLGSVIDNIIVDSDTGDLWLGAFPKPVQFLAYSKDFNSPLASQVIHLQFSGESSDGTLTYTTKEPFMNDGSMIKASSSALRYGNDLLIGGVFEDFVHCKTEYY